MVPEYVLVQGEVIGTDRWKARGKKKRNIITPSTPGNCLVKVLGLWKCETARGESVAVILHW